MQTKTSKEQCRSPLFIVVIALAWLLLGLGCAVEVPVPKHNIMGSDFGLPNYRLTLQTETERATFHIKLFSFKLDECTSGFIDYVEFDGAIDKDALDVFASVLNEAQSCKTRIGRVLYPFVYLNSTQGVISDGYALGELFRRYKVETIVTQSQFCRGACAVAFMGGDFRKIQGTGLVGFASNSAGQEGIGIVCEHAAEQVRLRAYLQKMMELRAADRLYFNLLNYCTQPKGWVLESDAARTWGVVNE